MNKRRKNNFSKTLWKLFAGTSLTFRKRLFVILSVLLVATVALWIFTFAFSPLYPTLFGFVVLAYGFGLRHAVDADHIAAIDTVTRKLMHEGKRPITVGLFFSLGHATVVIFLSVIAAFSADFIKYNLPAFSEIGGIIGASVSSIFLIIIGISNVIIFLTLVSLWKKAKKEKLNPKKQQNDFVLDPYLENRGLLTRLLRPLLKKMHSSWQMYFVGFLFGLGFDTATEIGLLSISAVSGASGLPIGIVLLVPFAFTAGMVLIDTLDGIFMLGAYGWAYVTPLRKLSYNLIITGVSLVVALSIGLIQAIQLILSHVQFHGEIFSALTNFDFGNFGYFIIGVFLLSGVISLLLSS